MKYRFDSFEFDPAGHGLSDDGATVSLEPQAIELLRYLIENRDRIISKDELIDHIWQGRIITDAALNTRIRSIRRALGDDRSQQRYVKTFPKRGFQFVGVIEADGERTGQAEHTGGRMFPEPKLLTAFAAALLIIVAGTFYLWTQSDNKLRAELPLPKRPSIAVLRFSNLNEDTGYQYFVDGLTEDIITNLSLNRELFVISRNSSFGYKAGDADMSTLAKELGVAFIARGSVRRVDDRVRINSELIEARTGRTIWAERFDRALVDVFAIQDDISQSIAARLAPEIVKARVDHARSKRTENLDAWDLYLKAKSSQYKLNEAAQSKAVRLALLAIKRDGEFAAPYSLIARAKGIQFFYRWTDDPDSTLKQAIEYARSAIRLDANDPVAFAALGYVYRFTGDADRSIANLDHAAKLNPNDANIRLELAHTLDWFRRQKRALPEIERAIRLSPRDPLLQNMYFYKAHILFHLKRFEDSLAAARDMGGVLSSKTWRVWYHMINAANLAELGRASDAKKNVDSALELNPKMTLSAMRRRFKGSKNHPDNRRIWLASLSKAGVPEK